jgi:L-ribulose-5-phosphate 4-epimerase
MAMSKYLHIQEEAYEANLQLPRLGLVVFTFGNVSAIDRSMGVFAIKPSGVDYEVLDPGQMVVVDLEGRPVQGKLRPSSDTLTHAVLYKAWPEIGGISHTHSCYATAWAQAQRDIPVYGTTHADHSPVDIPCAEPMNDELIGGNYELETGHQILSCFKERGLNPQQTEMILVGGHAPFTWGSSAGRAVYNSAILEYLAKAAFLTETINADAARLKNSIISKHHKRKHGPDAYYGQNK